VKKDWEVLEKIWIFVLVVLLVPMLFGIVGALVHVWLGV